MDDVHIKRMSYYNGHARCRIPRVTFRQQRYAQQPWKLSQSLDYLLEIYDTE